MYSVSLCDAEFFLCGILLRIWKNVEDLLICGLNGELFTCGRI